MGRDLFTATSYVASRRALGVAVGEVDTGVTRRAEVQARAAGRLHPLVDPAGYDVIRESRPRLEEHEDGRFVLTVGTPLPVATLLDTTGSMGGNVDVALRVLPAAVEAWRGVLPDYDLHVAISIFGDVVDQFPLCRPQYEMLAERIVEQLTCLVPERAGGDAAEDPDLGLFGEAYLTRDYASQIGIKGYHFTVTDAPGRGHAHWSQLRRVYGAQVYEKTEENGFALDAHETIPLEAIWAALLDRAHAFVLLVRSGDEAQRFWRSVVGPARIVALPRMDDLPAVQAAIIGLTEGTLCLSGASAAATESVEAFLSRHNVSAVAGLVEALGRIPQRAQTLTPGFANRPRPGAVFAGRPNIWARENLWPVDSAAAVELPAGGWL